MGYSTDFVGHLEITPPLNAAENTYLEAFRHTRHFDRGSPYDVPGNPMAPDHDVVDRETYSVPGPGKPQLYCQWTTCSGGCCLTYDGTEKFYAPIEWLRYLIDHLLKPGAAASSGDHPLLEDFTFDHHLNGLIVGCRRDDRELFAIEVSDNVVTRKVMRRGDPDVWSLPPLAYQETIDRDRAARIRRRNDSPAAKAARSAVIDLTERRGPV